MIVIQRYKDNYEIIIIQRFLKEENSLLGKPGHSLQKSRWFDC